MRHFSLNNTSEIICETPFNLKEFYDKHKYVDPLWLGWFIGFTEGDGSLILDKSGRITFVITQKDPSILYHIQEVLGFGNIRFDKEANSFRYVVGDKPSIIKLIYLFNGNLFLKHRINQLKLWISNVPSINIKHVSNPIKITLNDSWISGFTDAEGCFNVNIFKRKASSLGLRVVVRFLLDQKDEDALLFIRNLFGYGSVAYRSYTDRVYRFTSDSLLGTSNIVKYFNQHPLKTKKSVAFERWNKIRTMILNKEHLSKEGLETIILLSKLVNEK